MFESLKHEGLAKTFLRTAVLWRSNDAKFEALCKFEIPFQFLKRVTEDAIKYTVVVTCCISRPIDRTSFLHGLDSLLG